jgi:hypothetical protein
VTASRDPVYRRDLYAWSEGQARLLRAGKLDQIDAENIAEEILDVGGREYDKLESAFHVLLIHALKWDHQPDQRSLIWENTIAIQRHRMVKQLRKNPSPKSRLSEALSDGYGTARLAASAEIDMDVQRFPEDCPYDWDTILAREFKR